MKPFFISVLLLFLVAFQSCLVDIPPSPGTQKNHQQIVIPLVLNSHINDSILSLISFTKNDEASVITFNTKITAIASSNLHLGFPDFVKFKGTWYVSMRFSEGHMPTEFGDVIIFKSNDLKKWEPEQVFMQKGYDLRDPKFFIANSILYVHFHSTTINPYGETRNDYISSYDESTKKWNPAIKIDKNTNLKSWFWRITANESTLYTTAYMNGEPLRLFTSTDGKNFNEKWKFDLKGLATETTLRFYEDNLYAIIRMEDGNALFGRTNKENPINWEFKNVNIHRFGGPNFLKYKDVFLLGGRDYKTNKTKLYTYNYGTNTLNEIYTFPSVLDTGYPGMIIENDFLYLVYFSGATNGKHLINLVVMDLTAIDI